MGGSEHNGITRKRDSKPCAVVCSRFRRFVSFRTNSLRSLHFATPRRRGTFREKEGDVDRTNEGYRPRRFSASMFRIQHVFRLY